MSDELYYKNKFRVPSTRYLKWNYDWNGWYFVTICTAGRVCYLGNVMEKKMQLSRSGKIVQDCWLQIPQHFSFVQIDQFAIMPNHLHGIIMIDKGKEGLAQHYGKSQERRDEALPRLYVDGLNKKYSDISPKPGSLSTIIGSFKSACAKIIRQNDNLNFAWQSRYHDRIIRDEFELCRIRKYVLENPEKWEEDELYPRP